MKKERFLGGVRASHYGAVAAGSIFQGRQMAPTERMYPKEEFCRRGDAIYNAQVRPVLKARDNGKFVAIDIESGAYQVHSDELKACDLLPARKPTAQIWVVRAGSRAVHHLRLVAGIT